MNAINFDFKELGLIKENVKDIAIDFLEGVGIDVDMNIMDGAFALLKDDMGITPDEEESARFEAVKTVLLSDVSDCNYVRIQKLLEAGDISSERLAAVVGEQRFISDDFKEMVYADTVSLLSNEIVLKPMLGEMFVSLYSEKYCNASQIVKSITKKGMAKNIRKMDSLSNGEAAFCLYLLMDTSYVSERKDLDFETFSLLKTVADYREMNSISDYEDAVESTEALTFSGTEDSIFLSRQFEKFLSKRKNEIAEFLGVTEGEIAKALTEDMAFSSGIEEKYNPSKAAKYVTSHVLIENKGGLCWLGGFAGSGIGMDHCYKPDIDRIIRSYYTVQAIVMYEHIINSTGRFTKLDLSKGWEVNPERDVQGICYMYCLDVFCNMFNEMMREYYRAFFEARFTPKDTPQNLQMEDTLNEQNLVIERQKEQIASLEKEIALLKEQSQKDDCMEKESEKRLMEYERKTQELMGGIEMRDKQIVGLKDYIKSQDEFLAIQNQTEEEPDESVNLDNLQAKKYLFVGKISEALPDLKRKFPGSVFMETETKDVSAICVDAIVLLTKWMSHSMFYKVKNSKIFRKVPSVMCNTKNINRIYYDMDKSLAFNQTSVTGA